MSIETKLLVTCIVLLASALIYAVLKVTGAWYDHHVSRHDLIAESKRRRYAYLRALAERDREIMEANAIEAEGSIVIDDDEAGDVVYAEAA